MPLPIVYHPDFVSPLPPEHRFPMPKFGKIYEVLLQHGIVPVACVVGGGYAKDRSLLAQRHSLLHRAASEIVGSP